MILYTVLVNKWYRNNVINARSYPGADANTDYILVAAKSQTQEDSYSNTTTRTEQTKAKGPGGKLSRQEVEQNIRARNMGDGGIS